MNRFFYLLIFLILIDINSSRGCTNFLITKGASADGSTMITYAADAGGFMEPLYYLPAMDHDSGEVVKIYEWDSGKFLGEIPQIAHTYRVVGNMNQHQVSIGETTFTGHKELKDSTGLIDYGSLMFLALQRAKTAREAIEVIDNLVQAYGYYSTGESFSIADPNEVWIFEIIGKGPGNTGAVWAARKIPDGYVAVHANQARIHKIFPNDPDNCLYSPDVMTLAKEKGYWDGKGEFSFADAYNPLDPGSALYCESRVWRFFTKVAPSQEFNEDYFRAVEGAEPYPLYIKPDRKLSVRDIQSLMRDHYEGTEYDMTKGLAAGPFGCPIRWKNLSWQIEGDTVNKYGWERSISTQQSAFTFVSQMRSFLPNEIGGVFWYGVDDAYSSCYIPLYSSMQEVPKPFIGGSIAEFDFDKAFWVFNLVANLAYTKYSYIIKDIQKVQSGFEDKFEVYQPALEKAALELYKQDPELAIGFLSDYSVSQSEKVVERWRELWKYLVVKYNDGYVNDATVAGGLKPKGVGYDNEFLKELIKQRPGYYDVKWRKPQKKVN